MAKPKHPQTRSGGEAYSRSDWALKTNERSAVEQMPLLGEFSSYSEWGKEAKRWAETRYNRPVSSVVDYFVVTLGASSGRIDIESDGRLKYKLRAKVAENEESIKNGVEFGPITAEWAFVTLKARHYEPAGQPITRITNQLGNLNDVIWKELGLCVRTPEGVWDWLGRKRREMGSLGRILTNREMFGYFRGEV